MSIADRARAAIGDRQRAAALLARWRDTSDVLACR
jgi:hypothetical protein